MKRKKGSTTFLKIVLLLISVGVLALCVFVLPEMASRDAAAHPETAYLKYPFLIYAYVLCIIFYIALYQAFKLLIYIDKNKAFSKLSVKSLRYIKRCAITISILIVVAVITSAAMFYGNEDITGIIMLALISIFASSMVATFAAVLQRLLQEAINIKSENDLTV